MALATAPIIDVEQWNDAFAREHDIDDYYAHASFPIRYIEQRRLACIRKMVAANPGEKILEVGCGGGHVLRQFPQARLTGVDVSGEMLAKAKRNLRDYDVTLLKGELKNLDLPVDEFDAVICTEVLEHVVNPLEILEGIRKSLRGGGRALITFPNDHLINSIKGTIRALGLTRLPVFRRIAWGGDEYHIHVWSRRQMRKLLGDYFKITDEQSAPNTLFPIRCCFKCGLR